MADTGALVRSRLDEYAAIAAAVAGTGLAAQVTLVAEECIRTYRDGGRLLLFGNGGSAADAAHAAAEFVGRCTRDRPGLAALALTDPAVLTALANDYGYEEVFARQVQAQSLHGDLVVGLSTSGRSVNVLRGLAQARSAGLRTVALTGGDAGALPGAADHVLVVPSGHTGRIQEVHGLWCHLWAEAVEAALFSS